MPTFSSFRQKCPRCAGKLRRTRRRSHDTSEAVGPGIRRYRCTEGGCGWEGLMPKLARRSSRTSSRARQSPLQNWLVPLALLALVALALLALSVRALRSETSDLTVSVHASPRG